MTDDPYVYPGTSILRNKLGIKNPIALEKFERLAAIDRAAEGVPSGGFVDDSLAGNRWARERNRMFEKLIPGVFRTAAISAIVSRRRCSIGPAFVASHAQGCGT